MNGSTGSRTFWRSQKEPVHYETYHQIPKQPLPLILDDRLLKERDDEGFTEKVVEKKPLSAAYLKEFNEYGMMTHAKRADKMIKKSSSKSSRRK